MKNLFFLKQPNVLNIWLLEKKKNDKIDTQQQSGRMQESKHSKQINVHI